jgi:hypothetical protein
MQLPEFHALHDGGLSLSRRRHRQIAGDGDERVQCWLAPLDALKRVAHNLDGRNGSFADLSCQLGR